MTNALRSKHAAEARDRRSRDAPNLHLKGPNPMSREEIKLALRDAMIAGYTSGNGSYSEMPAHHAEAWDETVDYVFSTVLNPLLERVAGALGPVATEAALWGGFDDAKRVETSPTDDPHEPLTVGDLRQAADLHTELKGLLDG